MSYILDALKKAQAERELGRLPALETLAAAPAGAAPGERAAGPAGALRALPWLVAVLALLLAAAAWWWSRGSGAQPAAQGPAAHGPAAQGPAVAGAAGASARPATPAPVAHAAPPAPVLPPVLPAPPPAVVAATPPPVPAAAASATPASPRPTPTPVAATPSTPAATEPAAAIIPLESLDAPTRARLPPLVNGGAIHSAARDQRMVILDGQVLREGEALSPEVIVQRIEPQGVVLQLGANLGNRRVRLKP